MSFDLPKDDVSTKSNIYNTVTADAALQAVEIAVRHCQLVKKQVRLWHSAVPINSAPNWRVLMHPM